MGGLSDAQREKLKKAGFNKKDLEEIDGSFDEDEDGPGRRGSGRRVFVLEGAEADSFLDRIFADDEKDDGDDEGDGEGDGGADDDDDEGSDQDEKPPSSNRYFQGKRKAG